MAKQAHTTVRFSEQTRQRLDELLATGESQTSVLERAISALWQDEIYEKPAVLRWLDILGLPGHAGEVDWSEVECAECGQDIDRPHYALMSDGRLLAGARCSECATSE
jgi:hypothetical protein